jgi:acyl transferase domain-containing protein/acyl carrier protein
MSGENDLTGLEIAVIGMSGRFPGAENIHQFWANLEHGVESITFFSAEELKAAGVQAELLTNPGYIGAKGLIDDIDRFDARLFGYTAREAELMDPQVRILHECAWEALEDGGYDPDAYKGLIGLFAGAAHNHYWEGLSKFSGKSDEVGQWTAYQLVDKDYLTMRLSHTLNLSGPSFSLYTACSTSLVAVHLACQAILNGECDMALAGGVTLMLPHIMGYLYREGMVMSADGHCRAFDDTAAGTVFGDGAGMVLLKRLEDARADRDHIYAVVRGSAINNDGIRKSGFTAPSVDGQAEVIRAAQQIAHVEPESIGCVETHGTGTNLGDPIEVEALQLAFATDKRNFCALGSVKTNVGHLDVTAGIAGFIKTVLALKHRLIPPSLHFEIPNREIDFASGPFYVNAGPKEWKNGRYPLRAGVSSFGIGGTNAHVILEEAPAEAAGTAPPPSPSRNYQLLLLSAGSESALEQSTGNLAEYVRQNPALCLADAAYTLQVGRRAFNYRRLTVCADVSEAAAALRAPQSGKLPTARVGDGDVALIFMFSGQGSQYVNMGLELYRTEKIFRQEMDRCFDILTPLMGGDVRDILYPGENPPGQAIDQTGITQPVLFVFEYGLARLLMRWGMKPYAMIGHSIGEYTAACLAGVFSLEDALNLVFLRGKWMQEMPSGAMLSVYLAEAELGPLVNEPLALAAVNGAAMCVVSGPHEAVADFDRRVKEERGCETRLLHTSHAFHSSMMEPILERFEGEVKKVTLNRPEIPYISNVTGNWITVEEAQDPGYWARHLRRTVRFADGITKLLAVENPVFIEVGPGRTLSTFVRKHPDRRVEQPVVDLIKHPREKVSDSRFFLEKIGRLWLQGATVDWQAFYADETRQRLSLPTYPFEGQRYWIDEEFLTSAPGMLSKKSLWQKKPQVTDWFYTPDWRRSSLWLNEERGAPTHETWLLFADDCGLGLQLAERLKQAGTLILVKPGAGFEQISDGAYTLHPGRPGDYESLFGELRLRDRLPRRILHLWNVSESPGEADAVIDTGFYSLLYLARAIGSQDVDEVEKIDITVVTNGMQAVTGEEELDPAKAAVLGPVMIMPLEYPHLRCRTVDVILPQPGTRQRETLVDQLAAESISKAADNVVAFRGSYRLVQTFEPVSLMAPEGRTPRLKERGVYLITGGLGGIGLVLASHLAQTVQARLVLIGRSAYTDHDPADPRAAKVQELEAWGAEVLVLSADVADYPQMQEAVEQAKRRFGPINGVIHAAGIAGGGVMQIKNRQTVDSVMRAKVKGTLVLDRLLDDSPLDFFLLCSSINSVLPQFGQVDYCAANAFLDAFAHYKSSRDGIFTAAVNWDTWQEVGMAARLFNREASHPLLDRVIAQEPERQVYLSRFRLDRHWVLNEHMTVEKKGILPGVVYLEMVRAAFDNGADNGRVEIRDVYFLNPLMVGDDEEREVLLSLVKNGGGGDFLIKSRPGSGKGEWQNHAAGKIAAVRPGKAETVKHDIRELESNCNRQAAGIGREENTLPEGLLIFGPRWRCVRRVCYGQDRGLALLELPRDYAADLGAYRLHPALLDSASGFLKGVIQRDVPYIPFSYKRLEIRGPLPARIYSFSRLVEDKDSRQDFLKFDITIMDEQGNELVDIQEFAMLRVSVEVKRKIKEKEDSASGFFSPLHHDLDEIQAASESRLKNGILPAEGIDVFNRVLGCSLPQVVVSTSDLLSRIKNAAAQKDMLLKQALKRSLSGPRHPRPELASAYVAPRDEFERTVAHLWQEVLGIEQVGIEDDFFELGGDSVTIIQLNGRLKEALKRDIPEVAMFRYQTISSFVEHLDQEGSGESAADTLMDRSEEIVKSKNRLKQRFNRR